MKTRKTAYTVITFQAVFALKIKLRARMHLFAFACHLSNNWSKQKAQFET